jgi:hypothetical protein
MTPAQMRVRIARAVRAGDPQAADQARRDYAAYQLEEHIKRIVDTFPPLTPGQQARLHALLAGEDSGPVVE